MIFGLTAHKLRVIVELVLSAAGGGAVVSITAAWMDPAHFDVFSAEHWTKLGRVALAGAFIGVFNLVRNIPRNPAAYQRRTDPTQVAKAAVKLGIAEPSSIPPVSSFTPKPEIHDE